MRQLLCILACFVAVCAYPRKYETDNRFADYDYNGFRKGEPHYDSQRANIAAQTETDWNDIYQGGQDSDKGKYIDDIYRDRQVSAKGKDDWNDVYRGKDSNEDWDKSEEMSGNWFSDDEDDASDEDSQYYEDETLSEEVHRNEDFLYDLDDDLTEDEKMIDELEEKVQAMQQTVRKYGRLKKKVHRMEKVIKDMQNMMMYNREMAEYKSKIDKGSYAKNDGYFKK